MFVTIKAMRHAHIRWHDGEVFMSGELEKWLKDQALVLGDHYHFGPKLDDRYRDPWPISFEFTDHRIATYFKLAFGTSNVLV